MVRNHLILSCDVGGPASELDRSAQCMHIINYYFFEARDFNVRSTGSGDSPVESNLVTRLNLAKPQIVG